MLNRRVDHFGISFLILIISLGWAWGEPVATIRNNGDPGNRVDFAILGDGYTAIELEKYASDVENFVNGFFDQEPFKEYKNYFNVHRVDVVSNESGADHPERGVYKDTAFDATYNCAGIQRPICVNNFQVNTVLSNSLTPDRRDMILVIVNDSEYGGSGGAIAVSSIHSSAVEIILHEVGHSFGLLADEYSYSPPACNNTIGPSAPNVTRETKRDLIKWNVGGGPPTGWIDFGTPIPTIDTTPSLPGLYEGAQYCTHGLYRPTYNSKMRSLYSPFDQINEEQLVKRIYNWVSPLDSYIPINTNLALLKGQSRIFKLVVPHPLTHSLEATWYVNGVYKYIGLQFTLDSTDLNPDLYTVEVLVYDPTAKVRNDPESLLTETRTWIVEVTTSISEVFSDVSSDYWAQHYITAI